MRRVVVLGASGAGKSTLARQLGVILGIEVIHLDMVFWQPGWVESPRDSAVRRHQELVSRERWIMDGSFARWGTLRARLAAADTVIWLDLPRWLCLRRVCWRHLRFAGRIRPDLGQRERFLGRRFWRLLRQIWRHPTARRRQNQQWVHAARNEGKRVVHLTSRRAVSAFLHRLRDAP